MELTSEQLDAVTLRPRKLLVSAAAGSGKTTVLTERIIRELTDKEEPADISDFLIVTYTRAAAEDLRGKIGEALRRASAADPENVALARQYSRLGGAHISTIHSFCAALVKRNFNRLSLSPSLKVCEADMANELKSEVMDELIEEGYAGRLGAIPDFSAFADNFVTGNDARLADILLKLYERSIILPDGAARWEEAATALSSEVAFMETEHGRVLALALERSVSYCRHLYETCLPLLISDGYLSERYLPVYHSDIGIIDRFSSLLDKGADISDIGRELDGISFARLPTIPKQKTLPQGLYFKNTVREALKGEVKELKKLFYCPKELVKCSDGSANDDLILQKMRINSANIALKLIGFLREFDRRYAMEKKKLSLLDFSDLEQLTYKLLYQPDGSFSELCDEVSGSFKEIFVDEFQDVNPLQSKIFDALCRDCRIFQVGDIKQSIYGFRGAAPDIFAECRRSYRTYVSSRDGDACERTDEGLTVFLRSNFRSAFTVTQFVNRVFDVLFHTHLDYPQAEARIPYLSDDRLVCRRSDTFTELKDENGDGAVKRVSAPGSEPVRILLITPPGRSDGGAGEAELSAKMAEATVVADRIAHLVRDGVSPSDIAVLYRSEAHIRPLERLLRERGILTSNERGEKLADTPEVQLALSLLECVDDPHRDISLAGALRSPVFRVTMDELVNIRAALPAKNGSLYSALCKYTRETGFEKGKRFISFTERMRSFAQGESAAGVLWQIYAETEMFSLIYDGGEIGESLASARRVNLIRLHQLAGGGGLYGSDGVYTFIKRFRTLSETKDAPKAAPSQSGAGIRFMSFHSSKGLEFKYCFVCGLGNQISRSDQVADCISDDRLGIATKLRDATGIVKYDTPIRRALSELSRYEQFEEELRVLYVALTRARDALFISATVSDCQKLIEECRAAARAPHPFTFYRQTKKIKWIMTALFCDEEYVAPFSFGDLAVSDIVFDENGYRESDAFRDDAVKPRENCENGAEKAICGQELEDASVATGAYRSDGLPSSSNDAVKPRISASELDELTREFRARLEYVYPHIAAAGLPAKISVSKLSPTLFDDAAELSAALQGSEDGEETRYTDIYELTDREIAELDASESECVQSERRNQLKRPRFLTEEPDTLRARLEEELACGASPARARLEEEPTVRREAVALSAEAAEIGIATHLFMQFCDLENVERFGIDAELERLCERSMILPYHAAIADRAALGRFFASDVYSEMRESRHLRRETRFNIRLPASMFTSSEAVAEALRGESILVQGVMDCYYIAPDGKLVLLDYKTDRFPEGLGERAIASILKKRHSRQLYYYKLALERLMLRPVDRVAIFSFALGKAVEL